MTLRPMATWQVLAALSGVAPARVGGECWKPDQWNMTTAWTAPDSALGILLAKEPASLAAGGKVIQTWYILFVVQHTKYAIKRRLNDSTAHGQSSLSLEDALTVGCASHRP